MQPITLPNGRIAWLITPSDAAVLQHYAILPVVAGSNMPVPLVLDDDLPATWTHCASGMFALDYTGDLPCPLRWAGVPLILQRQLVAAQRAAGFPLDFESDSLPSLSVRRGIL